MIVVKPGDFIETLVGLRITGLFYFLSEFTLNSIPFSEDNTRHLFYLETTRLIVL